MTKTKLWQTSVSQGLNPLVEKYTSGTDFMLDQKLLGYDIQAGKAHVEMLHSIGLLNKTELKQIAKALDELPKSWESGNFSILQEQEDSHTAIEQHLVEKLGTVGKKIHTGRSRNDQSLVMIRLYMKEKLQGVLTLCDEVIAAFEKQVAKKGHTPMPGYTHMQKAMPTTIGVWLGSYGAAFKDMQNVIAGVLKTVDQNPLGSAAGFGSSININREYTTNALGFAKTQENPMYCGLSRGLFELLTVQALSLVMTLAGKFAQDMLLFTTQEFGFFSLPDAFTTGSSIMPQKKNYDLFEVMRGQAHASVGNIVKLQTIYGGITSGYQRDLQLTKAVLIESVEVTEATLKLLAAALPEIIVHEDKLKMAITEEMRSVERINELVEQGIAFRDAYVQVKKGLSGLKT